MSERSAEGMGRKRHIFRASRSATGVVASSWGVERKGTERGAGRRKLFV